jgi:hypothetical protein
VSSSVASTVDGQTVPPGSAVTLAFSTDTPALGDWLTIQLLADIGSTTGRRFNVSPSVNWVYTNSCSTSEGSAPLASGSCTGVISPTAPDGTYRAIYYEDNGLTVLAQSATFVVQASAPPPPSVSGTASVRSTPPTAEAQFSRTFGAQISLSLLNVPNIASNPGYVAIGQHSSSPGTYAALSATDVGKPLVAADWDFLQTTHARGFASITARLGINATALSAWTAGVQAWVALFGSNPPSSGDVPLFVLGPFTVVA